jgi:ATP-dependent 26S proteasome regulatory subunit
VSILQTITSAMSVANDLDLNEIGSKTELFSGADLQQLCKEVK